MIQVRQLTPLILLSAFLVSGHASAGIEFQDAQPLLLFGNLETFQEEVNLSPARGNRVEMTDDQAGFAVRKIKKGNITVGVRGNYLAQIADSGWPQEIWANIGLFPTHDSYSSFSTTVKNEKELDALDMKLPYLAQDALKMGHGDTIYFEAHGGVALFAMEGTGMFSLSQKLLVTGGWQTYIERKSESRVYAELRAVDTRSAALLLGNLVINVEVGKVRQAVEGQAYEFDLANPKAAEAYEAFVAGNLMPAQELGSTQGGAPVLRVGVVNYERNTGYHQFRLGTPFIPLLLFSDRTEVYTHTEDRSNSWGALSKSVTSMYLNDSQFRLFDWKNERVEAFQATVTDIQDAQNPLRRDIDAQAIYVKQSNLTRGGDLGRFVDGFLGTSGLEDIFPIEVDGSEDLGFAQVRFTARFPETFIRAFIANPSALNRIQSVALGDVPGAFFRRLEPAYSQNSLIPLDATTIEYREVTEAIEDMKNEVRRMESSIDSDVPSFTESYARFGKKVWSNSRLFRPVFLAAADCGMSYNFEVSGRYVTRLIRKQQFPTRATCLK